MANKTWCITGTSRGFGREWTSAALERGGFDIDWSGPSAKRAKATPEYAELHEKILAWRKSRGVGKPGEPRASARALFKVVDAKDPPLRVFFGAAPLAIAKAARDLGDVAAGRARRAGRVRSVSW